MVIQLENASSQDIEVFEAVEMDGGECRVQRRLSTLHPGPEYVGYVL